MSADGANLLLKPCVVKNKNPQYADFLICKFNILARNLFYTLGLERNGQNIAIIFDNNATTHFIVCNQAPNRRFMFNRRTTWF